MPAYSYTEVPFATYLPEDVKDLLKKSARREGISMKEYITRCIKSYAKLSEPEEIPDPVEVNSGVGEIVIHIKTGSRI